MLKSRKRSYQEVDDDEKELEIESSIKKPKTHITIELPQTSKLMDLKEETRMSLLQNAIQLAENAYVQAQDQDSIIVSRLKKDLAEKELELMQMESKCKTERETGRKSTLEEAQKLTQVIIQEHSVREKELTTAFVESLSRETDLRKQAEEKAYHAREEGRLLGRQESGMAQELKTLTLQITALTSSKSGTSMDKGKFGEHLVQTWLNTWFQGWGVEIKDVSHDAHKGDFIVTFPHPEGYTGSLSTMTLLLEVKFKLSITKEDVDKFHSDLDQNKTAKAGLFVSLKSKNIPGHRDLHYSYRNGKITGYVANDELDSQGRDVRSAVLLLRASYYEHSSTSDLIWTRLKTQAEQQCRLLRPNLQRLSDGIYSLRKTLVCLESLDKDVTQNLVWLEQVFQVHEEEKLDGRKKSKPIFVN